MLSRTVRPSNTGLLDIGIEKSRLVGLVHHSDMVRVAVGAVREIRHIIHMSCVDNTVEFMIASLIMSRMAVPSAHPFIIYIYKRTRFRVQDGSCQRLKSKCNRMIYCF